MDIYDLLIEKNYDVIGVENKGEIIGYIERESIGEGLCGKYIKSFNSSNLISESTSINELLTIFKDKTWFFVLEGNRVNKIVTRADLQKSPVRLLLFGTISLLEMNLLRVIRSIIKILGKSIYPRSV